MATRDADQTSATTDPQSAPEPDSGASSSNGMSAGTYEVLRGRLRSAADDLRGRLKQLDTARGEVFGNIPTELIATRRVTTDHNAVPCDLVAIGDQLLLGYNVQFGLKSEIELSDVFSTFRFEDHDFHETPLDVISEQKFVDDFHELYRYYKDTRFKRFFIIGPHLHMVFRVGKRPDDIKTFKWLLRDGTLAYIDNRSDHEVRDPAQHEFRWVRTTRDQHHYGAHPHISIEDRVFVEAVGGDLTVKVENNTESGEGIYAEPVENHDQTLDDAEIYYAVLGNLILLKIRPYQEDAFRYLVFNGKINRAMRLDEIEHSCVLLPGDHGIIFPGGYYLQTGEFKRFDHGLSGMRYQRTDAAPNGEDFLYVFYNSETGYYIQLRYNLIRQSVDVPIVVHGQTFFHGGEMVCFKAGDDPQKHHALQVWQTPFTDASFQPENQTDSLLFKVGNKDLVRGMSECGEVLSLIDKDDNYEGLYVDLVKKSSDILDSYFWIGEDEAGKLDESLTKIREAATAAVEEFEKVVRIRRETAAATKRVQKDIDDLVTAIQRGRFETIDDFVAVISDLRTQRGHALGLAELRYVDTAIVESLSETTAQWSERISRRCVDFLLSPGALDPYVDRVAQAETRIEKVATVVDAKTLEEDTEAAGSQLELLTETVSNLKIDDATKRTEIIDSISDVFASLNRVRSRLKARVSDLMGVEGRAEFASQMKLLDQTVTGYLDVCESPEQCETYLTKVMVQLEELEGRFAEFDEFVVELAGRRDEIYEAFESRKVAMIEQQNRRAESLSAAATRILGGIQSRVGSMDSTDQIAAYFAGDLMVEKVREIITKLGDMGDAVRVEDLQSRLKTIREDSVRQLKDRLELYVDGGDVIKLGERRFAVNRQNLDLTTVIREGQLCLHVTGTQYFEPLTDAALLDAKDLWNQLHISEDSNVYRGEYLAADWFLSGSIRSLEDIPAPAELADGRTAEAYNKGVHEVDAHKILTALVEMDLILGRLRHPPSIRAAARMWVDHHLPAERSDQFAKWIGGFAKIAAAYPQAEPAVDFRRRVAESFEADRDWWSLLFPADLSAQDVADYLFDDWVHADKRPVVSKPAADLFARYKRETENAKLPSDDPAYGFILARNWSAAMLQDAPELANYRDELAWLIFRGGTRLLNVEGADSQRVLEGMVGDHSRIQNETMRLEYDEFLERLKHYRRSVVPRYRALQQRKSEIVAENRESMKLEEFKPKVLTSFVRNRLLDEVYLPLIGDNLAKQMGSAGEDKRTDRMGLLLLISPPGYGKTTLMEYVANRLGIVFMKINGPAIGHGVTSLDPAEAPNAAAREEVERLNLALEMGDNVMLYLDDIQHTHPELLQKFISLCDATRKIEGVRNGKTRTYDLRGRRVAVVMAGNPYTESGERFQVPDMLSNRADVYNLGEIIGGNDDAFEMSYLENALTSNTVLAPLSSASPEDARQIIRAAERDSMENLSLESNISMDDCRDMVDVMKKLIVIRDVVLKVNRAYIQSAAQADEYRTEPPFKLQGSYRNMNRIAEKVAAVMNDEELQSLIIGAYEQEAQTLTTDNEANVLKFKELMGIMTPADAERWESIKYAFSENVRMAGMAGDDAAAQLMRQLASMRDGLESIRKVIAGAAASAGDGEHERAQRQFEAIRETVLQAGSRLSASLDRTGKQLETISRQQALQPPKQSVLVQHKVPRVLADLVKGQFHLMQEWLRPLLDESLDNGRDLDRLQKQLQAMAETYSQVQASFEGSLPQNSQQQNSQQQNSQQRK
ncbi:MAG: DNA repair ATPase [Planctomycetota bacterium]